MRQARLVRAAADAVMGHQVLPAPCSVAPKVEDFLALGKVIDEPMAVAGHSSGGVVTLEGLSVPGIDAGYASATAARPPSVPVMSRGLILATERPVALAGGRGRSTAIQRFWRISWTCRWWCWGFVAERLGIADPSCVKKDTRVLGRCGCRGPQTVDRLLGRREALGGQRDQAGHGRRYLGEGELGGDEARLQAGGQDGVR